jgi:hypothetical protein
MRIITKQINHTRSFPEGKICSQEEKAVEVWSRCSVPFEEEQEATMGTPTNLSW